MGKEKPVWVRLIREGFLEEVKLDGEEGRGFGSAKKTREKGKKEEQSMEATMASGGQTMQQSFLNLPLPRLRQTLLINHGAYRAQA